MEIISSPIIPNYQISVPQFRKKSSTAALNSWEWIPLKAVWEVGVYLKIQTRYIEKQEQRASHPIYTGSCLQRGELYFGNPSVLWPDRQPTWLCRIRCLTPEKINLGDRNPNLNFLTWRQTEWPGVPQQSLLFLLQKNPRTSYCARSISKSGCLFSWDVVP